MAVSRAWSCPDNVQLLLLLVGGATVSILLVEYCPHCSFCHLLFDNKVQAKILKSSRYVRCETRDHLRLVYS